MVQNEALGILDPCGFTTLKVTDSNLQWSQYPSPAQNDGNLSNNYGDVNMDCGDYFTVWFEMTFCNSQVKTNEQNFALIGKADGNTGCWSIQYLETNTVRDQ